MIKIELPVVGVLRIKEEKFYQTHTDGGVSKRRRRRCRRLRDRIEHTPFSIQIQIKFRAIVIGAVVSEKQLVVYNVVLSLSLFVCDFLLLLLNSIQLKFMRKLQT